MRASHAGFHKNACLLVFSVSFFLLSAAHGSAQIVSDVVSAGNPNQTTSLSVSNADKLAASQVVSSGKKMILPPKAGYGVRESRKELSIAAGTSPADSGTSLLGSGDQEGAVPAPGYYTSDLSNPTGGPVITSMLSHPLFLNTLPGTVGFPGVLLRDLGKSNFVHVIDQYVGTTADDRYKVGLGALVIFPALSGPLYDADIQAAVHAAAKDFRQSGYHFEYHVFTGPGQDVCFEKSSSPVCYSPDNNATFFFCAYHGSAVFHDIGEVIYSVIPYQAVPGCQVGTPSPNGPVVDSTMSVLSHEFFESITDPDGDAWLDNDGLDLFGAEIGDICQNATFVYPVVSVNGRKYELQAEYSNRYHACAYVP